MTRLGWSSLRALRLSTLAGTVGVPMGADLRIERKYFIEGETLRVIDENGSRSFPLDSVTSVRIVCRTKMPWWLRPGGAYRRLWEGCLFRTRSGQTFRLSSFDCPSPQVAELCAKIATANPSLKITCGAPYFWWLSLVATVALGVATGPALLIAGILHGSPKVSLLGAAWLLWLLPVTWIWSGKTRPRRVDPRSVDVQFGEVPF